MALRRAREFLGQIWGQSHLPDLRATNKGSRWVFVFGFPKNERSNIDKDETEALKKLAAYLLSLTPQALGKAQSAGELIEVECDAEDQVSDPCRRA